MAPISESEPIGGLRRLRQVRFDPLLLSAPGVAAFVVFVAAPFVTFVVYSFLTAGIFTVTGPFTLHAYDDAVRDGINRTLALNSFKTGISAAVITVALGLPIAYWLRYAAARLQLPVLFLFMATIFAGYLVRIYAWRTMLGENGIINSARETTGLGDDPLSFLLFSPFSVTVAFVHLFLPLVVVVLFAGFRPLESSYLEAAQDLGASVLTRWRRVILPVMAAPAATMFLVVFVIASSDWATPLFLGGTNGVMLGQRIREAFKALGDYPQGAALSILMLGAFALCYALTALALRFAGVRRIYWTSATPGGRQRSPFGAAVTVLAIIFLYLPLAVVVLFSFHKTSSLSLPFDGFSLRWYRQLVSDPIVRDASEYSLYVALVVSAVTLVLGTFTAYGLSRSTARVRGALASLLYLPLALPALFTGLALFSFFARIQLKLGFTTLVIGHLVVASPFFLLLARAAMDRLDPALEETAADLGAGPLAVFRRVVLPQIWPILVGGASLAFALSFDEFPVSSFTSGSEVTVPLYVFSRLRQTVDPLINSIATLLMAISLVFFALAFILSMRGERRRGSGAG